MIPAIKAVLGHSFETIVESGPYNISVVEKPVHEWGKGKHYTL